MTHMIINEEIEKGTGITKYSVSGEAGNRRFFRLGPYDTEKDARSHAKKLEAFEDNLMEKPK
jgi:hypothetical protein